MDGCLICGRIAVDRCHIKSKGAGGTMEPDNLLLMCRFHHRLQHGIGWGRFVEMYPVVRAALREKGWHVVEEFGIKRLRRIG